MLSYPLAHSRDGDIASAVRAGLYSGATKSVKSVTIRSAISPEVTFTGAEIFGPGTLIDPRTGKPASPGQFGVTLPGRAWRASEAFMRLIKPEVEVDTPTGRITVAPYGRAQTNWFWPLAIVGTAGAVALTVLAIKGRQQG